MKSGLTFLLAARRCEIAELERLARSCELVGVIGRLVHGLQRERGISNIFLASGGTRSAGQREQQVVQCRALQQRVVAHFDRLDTEAERAPNGSRVFSRVALVLHGLEELSTLRARIGRLEPTASEATAGFVRLIGQLLAVVFEAADSAGDPDVSRALVALFNFMQGKEFAGQERAFGAAIFASGRTDSASRRHWLHLIELQQGCLEVFLDHADPAVIGLDHASQSGEQMGQLEQLRRVGCALLPERELDRGLSQLWYEVCTRRIDAMHSVEESLALRLRLLCERKMAQARDALQDEQRLLVDLRARDGEAPAPGAPYGPQLERSVLSMLQEQSRRLQTLSDELDRVRAALNERKLVERAKGLLMAHRQVSEEEAHKLMRKMAMNQGRRLVDVAQALLGVAEVLPDRTAGTH